MNVWFRSIWSDEKGQDIARIRGNVGSDPGTRGWHYEVDRLELKYRVLQRRQRGSIERG
jgi:hypothetical protein